MISLIYEIKTHTHTHTHRMTGCFQSWDVVMGNIGEGSPKV